MRQTELVAAAALCLVLALPAPARAALSLAGVDGITSTVLQQDQSSFSGLALRARVRSDALVPQLVFMPTVEWWRSHSTIDPYGIQATRKDAALGLDARWEFHAGATHPYAGGGFALHFLSSDVHSAALGLDETQSTMRGGLTALGGLEFPIGGHIANFFEVKYHHLPGARQVKLNWGLSYGW